MTAHEPGPGHVFHPGHHELHGITVVVETSGPHTYIGRFDTQDSAGVHLLDVGVHGGEAGGPSKDEYIRRTAKFGSHADRKHVVVPAADVARILRLADIVPA